MATNLKISGLDLVLSTKIAWKIQIWRCICCIRCLTCSNLTFWAILWLFFSYFKNIWQLFAMNPKLAKTFDTIFLTNFLRSFTWWESHACLLTPSLTYGMVYKSNLKIMSQKWLKMHNFKMLCWSYVKSDSKFKIFMQFWYREQFPKQIFTYMWLVEGII